jgi:chloramphenicol 3-O-phosphotransferase
VTASNAAPSARNADSGQAGRIVVLNGPPRSGKSSIADVIQETFDGPWLNLGADVQRRNTGQPGREGRYRTSGPGGEIPEPVRRWQREVHQPGIYDLEIDTSAITPVAAATLIRERLGGSPPTAFRQLAEDLTVR